MPGECVLLIPSEGFVRLQLPNLDDDDCLIIVSKEGDDPVQLTYIDASDTAAKTSALSKRVKRTLIAEGVLYDPDSHFPQFCSKEFTVHNLNTSIVLKTLLIEVIGALVTGDTDGSKNNLNAFKRGIEEDSKYRGATVLADGTMPEYGMYVLGPPAGDGSDDLGDVDAMVYDKNFEIDVEVKTAKAIIRTLVNLDHASQYSGFDAKIIRQTFIGKCANRLEFARDLSYLLMAYTRVHNNIGKIEKKREDVTQSKKLAVVNQKMGMKVRALKRDDLTLPRIALAFMPELLIIRRYMIKDLQAMDTDDRCDPVFRDIAFRGCSEISRLDGYADFHIKMSAAIYKISGKKNVRMDSDEYGVDEDDAGFLKENARWEKVVIKGYKSETSAMKARMTAIIQWKPARGTQYRAAALGKVMEAYDYYSPDDTAGAALPDPATEVTLRA